MYKQLNYQGTKEYFIMLALCDGAENDKALIYATSDYRNQASCYNASIRGKVIKEDSKCKTCGSTEYLQLDHIKEVIEGGKNDLSNIDILCRSCNVKKNRQFLINRKIKNRLPKEERVKLILSLLSKEGKTIHQIKKEAGERATFADVSEALDVDLRGKIDYEPFQDGPAKWQYKVLITLI